MSGWISPTHPAPSPITWGAEGWRFSGLQLTRELCYLCRQRVVIFSLAACSLSFSARSGRCEI